MKQLRINESVACSGRVCQDTLDNLVVDFVVNGAHEFSVVEEPSFVNMLQCLAPNKKVMTRRMVTTRIESRFRKLKSRLQDTFQRLQYVTVTADCWSSHHR